MTLLIPGETCWRTDYAERVAFLIDTEAYFTALYEAMLSAKRSIQILGWGFDPRARLQPDGYDGPADPDEVGRVLLRLAEARPDLDIRLLIWRSALPIAASQEFFPHRARRWFEGSRVKFRLDDQVPLGACHHQKVVVIDDVLAFCGGGDIAVDRWDTARHLDHDRRRIMPDQECHAPRHEVVMMVDGAAARALGEHFRERWFCLTGETLAATQETDSDPWPSSVPAQILDSKVSIARTRPDWRGQDKVEEILNLTLACIANAKDIIYLENQYFTSPLVAAALAKRLAEPDGPEIVLVATGSAPSWFDRLTMDRPRGAMVWLLRDADRFGRFRAYFPITARGAKIIVHSKTSVFDDRVIRVGSANLNNRSFGFDSECELTVEGDTSDARRNISVFRDRSVGHFLGYSGDAVAKARDEHGGLIPAIEALNLDGRLAKIDPQRQTRLAEYLSEFHLGDPAGVSDSWRPGRRRDRLNSRARDLLLRHDGHRSKEPLP